MASIRVLTCVLLLAAAVPAQAQTAGKGACHSSTVEDYAPSLGPKARAFLGELRTAVKGGDRRKVAALIQYPLRVNLGKGTRLVRSSAEFVKDYDAVFTVSIRKAIERQVPACLFANYQGVMIGDGEVWFEEQQDGSMKIKALNP